MPSFYSDVCEFSSCDCFACVHVSTNMYMTALCDFYIKFSENSLVIILLLKVCGNGYFICNKIAVIFSLFFVNLYKDLSNSVFIILVWRVLEVETGFLYVA